MNKPILLCDLDGPLADFDLAFWRMCLNRGWRMNIESLDDPGRKRFLTDNMVDRAERVEARRMVEATDWFRRLPVTEGALDGVPELMEWFDVWVCTKPLEANLRCHSDKFEWISTHFPDLEHKLIIAPDKSLVLGSILLDDAPRVQDFERAMWEPVVFGTAFNGPGSPWDGLAQWNWNDRAEDLLYYAEMVWR